MIYHSGSRENDQQNMREWRNRQTRTFEGRVGQLVRVQVPSLAPKLSSQKAAELFFYLSFRKYKGTWTLRGWEALRKQSGGLFLASKSEVGYRMRSIGSTRSQDLQSKAVSRLSHQENDRFQQKLVVFSFIRLAVSYTSSQCYCASWVIRWIKYHWNRRLQ